MATFSELEDDVRLIVDVPVDIVALLRQAENLFIKQTLCTEKIVDLDTSLINEGVLTNIYNIPDNDLVEVLRIEFAGFPLEPAHINPSYQFNDSDNQPVTGTPGEYRVAGQQIRLIPQPNSHGIIRILYSNMNKEDSSESPIIPETEQEYITDWVIGKLLESDNKEDRAMYYLEKFQQNVRETQLKYRRRRGSQRRITDVTGGSFDNVLKHSGLNTSREGIDGWAPS